MCCQKNILCSGSSFPHTCGHQLQVDQDLNNLDRDDACLPEEHGQGIVVPPVECTPTEQDMSLLRAAIDPTSPSRDYGQDIYASVLNYVLVLTE
ncbi:hypothetical protein J4Q44_G00169820 [Coregonus suidteri]|uniref:Uncharacterized protein n=1 Tax=Coregonus suidteri TaxID=861788 RepID=A0AAN8LIA7_9TELE